jgi:hypothetical protein
VPRSYLTIDGFFEQASTLRQEFDAKFADPRRALATRFVWDYWNVPGQYTALRTPAWTYFSAALYKRWHTELVGWGRRVLGCHDVSPPWLSNYVEGCKQELHGDLPHGPWAFVYSLTHWQSRVFSGGETMMLRDEALDFWHNFTSVRSLERADVLRLLQPRFNRLTVFDPRIPHGVREVRGTTDPREGRLVMHGWFVNPRPFVVGGLSTQSGTAQLAAHIDRLTAKVSQTMGAVAIAGMISFEIKIGRDGTAQSVVVLSDTTRGIAAVELQRRRARGLLRKHLMGWKFASAKQPSTITLPLLFQS